MSRIIKIISITFFLGLTTVSSAQISEKAAKKSQKKANKAIKAETEYTFIKELIYNKSFHLDASSIQDRRGVSRITAGQNYIKIDSNIVVIQTANPHLIGSNGLGGVTIQGKINDYEINEKNGTINLLINTTNSVLGQTSIRISANGSTNTRAVIKTAFGNRVTFIGSLRSLENEPYQGIRSY